MIGSEEQWVWIRTFSHRITSNNQDGKLEDCLLFRSSFDDNFPYKSLTLTWDSWFNICQAASSTATKGGIASIWDQLWAQATALKNHPRFSNENPAGFHSDSRIHMAYYHSSHSIWYLICPELCGIIPRYDFKQASQQLDLLLVTYPLNSTWAHGPKIWCGTSASGMQPGFYSIACWGLQFNVRQVELLANQKKITPWHALPCHL